MTEIVIYAILALIIGAVIGFLIGRSQGTEKASNLKVQCEVLQTKLSETIAALQQRIQELKEDAIDDLRQMQESYEREKATLIERFENEKATLVERYENEKETLIERYENEKKALVENQRRMMEAQEERHQQAVQNLKETFEQTIEHLKTNLKAATEDLLKSRQEEFSDLNMRNMQGIVSPLNETIAKMKEAMEGYSKEQSEFSGTMKSNLDTIIRQTETARQSAEELTTALKHDSKVQGDYGEAILDEILSKQGFTKGVHYEVQYVMKDENDHALKDEEGSGLRPDVIFHLDTVRDVIIDSKVNLTDFINYANAKTPEERKFHLERHVKSLENQVKLLSQKNYSKYHKKTNGRMDYVIMFVPISAAWWEALRAKPDLWREAIDNNVYIADEQTLFAALRIIKLTWTQIAQVNNQKEIFELATEMIDRVGQFMKSYNEIGEALAKAQIAYNKGEDKLTPGGQSILKTADKLLKKGVQDSRKNSVARFLDVDDIEQLPEPGTCDPQ